ncbi:MAG: ferritin [Thermotogae bacterium]|uniref:ferritin n=1 Tax=Kosmotoga sp. TaxID=1955248 RepID=UPI000F1A8B49|nr:ferritin [Kosmotoga sp.]MBO8166781.1 ferritin [Kosmotoga sp.]MCD6160037.1 ferritin [Kosmotoga sp.]RKX48151.1 MAG: ferritin [Thermotogota bacterium]
MLKERMKEAINKQINEELYSAYLYLSMSGYFNSIGLKGFANWMMVQYKEETDHAMKLYNYLLSQGSDIKLLTINEPPHIWDSPLHAFEETLKHEQHITECINELVDLAEELKDRATYNFLQWYINEQVEEEENDREIIDKLNFVGDSKNGIFMIDNELAQRKYVPLIQEGV